MLLSLIKYSFRPSHTTCWNCKSNEFVNRFICGECKYLKEPIDTLKDVNYFDLFDLDIKYDLDIQYLENKYRSLQMRFHPDIYIAQTNVQNMTYSQEYSSFINEAYSILKNDTLRAEYLLALQGFHVKESTQLNDLEFMEEILDLQQQIQEGENIEAIQQRNESVIKEWSQRIAHLVSHQQYQQAFNLLLYLRYRLRLRDQIDLQMQQ